MAPACGCSDQSPGCEHRSRRVSCELVPPTVNQQNYFCTYRSARLCPEECKRCVIIAKCRRAEPNRANEVGLRCPRHDGQAATADAVRQVDRHGGRHVVLHVQRDLYAQAKPGNTSVGKRSELRKCRRRDLVRTVRVASRPSAEAIRSRVTVSCTLRAFGGMSNVQLLLRTRAHGVGKRASGVSASDKAHARKWTSHVLDRSGPCWAVLARGWLRMLQRLQEAGPLAGDRRARLAVRRWVRVLGQRR